MTPFANSLLDSVVRFIVKISVIVPAFNEEKLLAESLLSMKAAMAAFQKRGWNAELVVCDNNSKDRTAEIARAAGAIVVFEPVNQIARARNAGAAAASGDWFVFVDADSRPTLELFDDVAEAIVSRRVLAGGSTVRLDEPFVIASLVTSVWNCVSRINKWAAGSFIFCSAEAFRAINGFSAELFVAEELDLSKRLKELARQRGQKMIILARHPLMTSARKVHLYGPFVMGGFFLRIMFTPRRTMMNRELCQPWYDGKR